MAKFRMTQIDAEAILSDLGIAGGADFHTIPASTVRELVERGLRFGYCKPKDASGSYGRYFHAYVDRVAHS